MKQIIGRWVLATLLACATAAQAEDRHYIDLYPMSDGDVELILDTLELSVAQDRTDAPPIVMMIHGEQANRFLRGNYESNKAVIDQTAKLAAYDVIDVKICESWLRRNKHSKADLFPFIDTVRFAPAEIQRLSREDTYSEYAVDL